MNATELKSLLYTYLAILRTPGGGERIGFAIEQHIKSLDKLETYGNNVNLRDLPAYSENMERAEYREVESTPDPTSFLLPSGWGERGDSTV